MLRRVRGFNPYQAGQEMKDCGALIAIDGKYKDEIGRSTRLAVQGRKILGDGNTYLKYTYNSVEHTINIPLTGLKEFEVTHDGVKYVLNTHPDSDWRYLLQPDDPNVEPIVAQQFLAPAAATEIDKSVMSLADKYGWSKAFQLLANRHCGCATEKQRILGTAPTVGTDGQGQVAVYGKIEGGVSVVNPTIESYPPFEKSEPIYGVEFDTTASGDSAVIRTDDAVGKTSNGMLSVYPWSGFSEVTDSYGNVFVRIPKHYIKIWDDGNTRHYQVSKAPFPGSWLPWCFWDFDNEEELDYVDYGKYTASVDGSNRLESKPDKYPGINHNIVQMRTYAENNGTGYQQTDIHTEGILQILFTIHHKVRNSQSIYQGYASGQYNDAHDAVVAETNTNRIIIATAYADLYQAGQAISVGTARGSTSVFYGRTITSIDVYDASNKAITFDGDPVNIAVGNNVWNSPYKSGWSTELENGFAVANDGKSPCAYMGIENPWGNQWKFVDGVNINDNQSWIALDARDYASNVFASPYKEVGYVNANTNGYIEKFGLDALNPWAMFPTTLGSSAFWGDYYYQNTGARVALLGGYLYTGSRAGLRFWSLYSSSSSAHWYIGGRLVRKAVTV